MTARGLVTCIVAALVALASTPGSAEQGKRVAASASWVKLPASGQSQTMAGVTIENPTMYGIYVTAASTNAAGKIELRDGSQGGEARLKAVEFISVPAYDRVDMGPNGPHLILIDLKRPLTEGDTVALALTTDNAGTLEVTAVVQKE